MHIQSLDGQWMLRRIGEGSWIQATVPGSVHVDLLRAGLIPDPVYADNEIRLTWIAESDWLYRRTFNVDEALLQCERIFLQCEGLDTLATIRLNDEEIARTDNMHRRYEFDITGRLGADPQSVEVEFASPVKYALAHLNDEELVISPSDSIPGSPYVRKAMYQWGWDWAPKLPTSGIWRPIRLAGYSIARIRDVHIRQVHTEEGVRLGITVRIERFSADDLVVVTSLISPQGDSESKSADLPGGQAEASIEFLIEYPQLWWPNGYGDQPLYTVAVDLFPRRNGSFRGCRIASDSAPDAGQCIAGFHSTPERSLDSRSLRIGLRSVELVQDSDEWGRSFYFRVNGVPVFCKGANWVPMDQFPARVSENEYRDLIASAAAANMNMLRIWGGGIYEHDCFYDLCDEYGILLWHDFMFAGAHYPMSSAFLTNILAEAADNIRRIRHHPSLALWCGNNEMEWFLARGWASDGDEKRKDEYLRVFRRMLPDVCAEHDPDTPYWPSSPASNEPFNDPNGESEGDGHYWEVWHGRALFTAYRLHHFRFMSEFGFQSLPSMGTISSFAPPEEWNISSYVMETHQKSYVGNQQIMYDLIQMFRMPGDFPMLVYVSQILQAEAIRYGVEHWRRNRNGHRCMGTLYWQLNDCWPVASWSSIECNHNWKALHYFARRFYAHVLLSVEEAGCSAQLHVTNDLWTRFTGTVEWSLEQFDGTVLQSGTLDVDIPPGTNSCVAELDFSSHLSSDLRRRVVLVHELRQGDQRMSVGITPFAPNKHLELPEPHISVEVTEADDCIEISACSDHTARFVMLDVPGVGVRFSDNFFDLPARRSISVRVEDSAGLSANEIAGKLNVVSLRDSY